MSRLTLFRSSVVGSLVCCGFASSALAQEIYLVNNTREYIVRVDADGSNEVVVLTVDDLIPLGFTSFGGFWDIHIDAVARKLYWVLEDHTSGQGQYHLLRSDLDGTNIESIPGQGGATGESIRYPTVYRPTSVPAIGNIGLGIMVGTLLVAGAFVMKRRQVAA